ncbi:methyltransferase-like 26 isoform X2 [Cherax quadricarinatus]|uniref:methyltransferase-like 26 isoform X2 n=1 Tax=Cherax quadricarinatus TaxID=27406 RepID=UPI002378C0EF|nr:methyltransferase-like 26 isoform X2 [Cherax quadricarinatus]
MSVTRVFFGLAKRVIRTMSQSKIVVEAAERNKEPILKVLEDVIPEKFGAGSPSLSALEISSGSGQHVVYFAEKFKNIMWQPSDIDEKYIESIKGFIADENLENVKSPLVIDITKPISEWPVAFTENCLDLIININMVHITPWSCTEGLFVTAGKLLKPNGIMITYGPYAIHGEITPESNVSFNASLKKENEAWGLRDVDDLEKEAKKNGMTFDAMFNMPANNKILVWLKSEEKELA